MTRSGFALKSVGFLGIGALLLSLAIVVSLKLLGPGLDLFRSKRLVLKLITYLTVGSSIVTGSLTTGMDEWFGFGEISRSGSKVVKNVILPRLVTWFIITAIIAGSVSALMDRYALRLEGFQAFVGALTCAVFFGLMAATLTSFLRDPWSGITSTVVLLGVATNLAAHPYTLPEILNPLYLGRRYPREIDGWALALHLSFVTLASAILIWLIVRYHARPQR